MFLRFVAELTWLFMLLPLTCSTHSTLTLPSIKPSLFLSLLLLMFRKLRRSKRRLFRRRGSSVRRYKRRSFSTRSSRYAFRSKSRYSSRRLKLVRGISSKNPFGDMMSAKFKFTGVRAFDLGPSADPSQIGFYWNDPNVWYGQASTSGTMASFWTVSGHYTTPPGSLTWLNQFRNCRITGVKVVFSMQNEGTYTNATTPTPAYPEPEMYFAQCFNSAGESSNPSALITYQNCPNLRFCTYKTLTAVGSSKAKGTIKQYCSASQVWPDPFMRQYINRSTITPASNPVNIAFSPPGVPLLPYTIGFGTTTEAGLVVPTAFVSLTLKATYTVYFHAWDRVNTYLLP